MASLQTFNLIEGILDGKPVHASKMRSALVAGAVVALVYGFASY